MVRHVAAFWCVLVLAVAASVAGQGQVGQVAQPVPTGEVQPESSAASGNDAPVVDAVVSRSDDQRARDLYLQGDRRYAEGDYEGAIAAFQSAYALSRRPLLLFNLANAFERAGYPDEAVEALRQYLPHAQRAEHDSIEKRMQNLRARATGPAESESVPEPDPVPDPGLDIRASARSADGVARSSALTSVSPFFGAVIAQGCVFLGVLGEEGRVNPLSKSTKRPETRRTSEDRPKKGETLV